MNSHNQLNIVKDKRSSMITDKYNTLTEVFSNQLSLQKESSNDSEKSNTIIIITQLLFALNLILLNCS